MRFVDTDRPADHAVATFNQAVVQINALQPDFVTICGDLAHVPDRQSIADFNAIRGKFAPPCFCVPGNHDVGNTPTTNALQDYRASIGADYYAFTHRGCRFVVSNTELWWTWIPGESDRHDAWFRETLKTAHAKGQPIYVMGHHPPFADRPDEPDGYINLPGERRRELFTLYRDNGVVAVLSGHLHKTVVREHQGVLFVCGETTSKCFDGGPLGYRVWEVAGSNVLHQTPVTVDLPVAAP